VRTFIYDGTEHPDPNTDFSPEQVKQAMANFYPELHNAEIKEIKRPNGDLAYEFLRRTGTKGSWKMQIKTAEDKDWVTCGDSRSGDDVGTGKTQRGQLADAPAQEGVDRQQGQQRQQPGVLELEVAGHSTKSKV